MWLHGRVPCLGIGRISKHNCALLDLDDTEVQIYTQLLHHVHTYNGATSGSSTTISSYFLGGDG